ncbi:MAG: efflux RND transporter periplasmic adaptor subunit [bacterium]
MENQNKTIENNKGSILKKPWIQSLMAFVLIFGILIGFLFWQEKKDTVFIENSTLEAPIVNLSPTLPGTLNALYVKEGDMVSANEQVALVGSQIISTKNSGIVASAPVVLGSYFSPGQTVVSIVNNEEMKVVGQIEETKGLNILNVGQRVIFSVDAFPSKNYDGILDQISPVSNENGIVFSISDKRPVKKFDVKVKFNIQAYPELKSGMSAKITVYTLVPNK